MRGGARRWIPLGFINLQPSEFAKIACVLVAAALAVEWQRGRIDSSTFMGRVAIYVGVPAVLIVFQPDLGTAVLLAVGVGIVLWLGGIEMRWVAAAVAAVGAVRRARHLEGELPAGSHHRRSEPWLDPSGKGYQSIQAMLAFGTGGLEGVGLGLSRQKFFYLPEAHTDFIFAIIGEEVGLHRHARGGRGVRRPALRGDPHRDGRARPVRASRSQARSPACSRSRRR